MCLLIEYMEYRVWHSKVFGIDSPSWVPMDYAFFLDDFTRAPYGAGFWRD